MSIILGIDPGSRFAGFGVIECEGEHIRYIAHGSIVLAERFSFSERLLRLGCELSELYRRYQPHATVIERIFLGKNADSAFRLGHARGVCLFHAAQAQSQIAEYATRSVKKGVTGSGAADKHTVQKILAAQFGLKLDHDLDASDALALAVYHARVQNVQRTLARALVPRPSTEAR